MLTIKGYKKLEALPMNHRIDIQNINEKPDRYTIWLSDNALIELKREPHWINGDVSYYQIDYYKPKASDGTEYVMKEMINTIGKMREYIKFLHDKYDIPF